VDARENGHESQYWDWYEWKDWPVPGDVSVAPPNPLDYYDCWWGFGQMPNLNFDLSRPNNGEHAVHDIADAAPNGALVEHLLDMAEYWLVEAGVDGYRLDVAGEVPFWFWKLFRERVREVKPDAYIVGELWGSSPEWVNGDYFDAVMNYKYFRDPVMRFICRGESTADVFDRELAPGRLIYPEEGVAAQMNLLGSHDTERFRTAAGGDIRRTRLAALFMMTYVGAPTIYYGDEIGMEGGGDPDCRRPFNWRWTMDGEAVRTRTLISTLAGYRRNYPMLVNGGFETLLAKDRVYSYRRRDDRGEVVVVLNAGDEEATVTVPMGEDIYGGKVGEATKRFAFMADLLSGERFPVVDEAGELSFTVTLPALTGSLYIPYLTVGAPTETED
jgi:glycosidase